MLSKKSHLLCFSMLLALNSGADNLLECIVEGTNETSVCILNRDCDTAKFPPQVCGIEGGEPLVCCPGKTKPGSIARDYCTKLRKRLNYATDGSKRRVNSGTKTGDCNQPERAVLKEHRHMVLLGYGNEHPKWPCEGVLISDQFVLTNAHCTHLYDGTAVRYVRLGDLDFESDDDGAQYQQIAVSVILQYHDYNQEDVYHNITLLKLVKPAILNDFVGPACLQTEQRLYLDEGRLELASWGRIDLFSERSTHLLKYAAELSSYELCNISYSNVTYKHKKIVVVEEQHICAYDPENLCVIGGSPLQVAKHFGTATVSTVVGVATLGVACGGYIPAVYTRVSNYIGWIEDNIWNY